MASKLLIFGLLIPLNECALAQASSGDQIHCAWNSKTVPSALKGNEGNSGAKDYWFGHVSDVDAQDGKHQFIYLIRNLHPTKLLPVEWLRSDQKAQVTFKRISPGGCASNNFETINGFREDSRAVINYGPTKKEKKTAPLFIMDNAEARKEGQALKSRLIADLQDAAGNDYKVWIEITSEVRDGSVFYTAKNFGTKNEILRIPTLAELRRNASLPIAFLQWPMEDDLLFISNDEAPLSLSISVSANAEFREVIALLEVVNLNSVTRESETVATATAILYLPVVTN